MNPFEFSKECHKMSPVREEAEQFGKSTNMWEATEFESLTSVEPMDTVANERQELNMCFEDHGNVAIKHFESETILEASRDVPKKRASFVEHPEVVKFVDDGTDRLSETYDFLEQMDDSVIERNLVDKLDSISVSTPSEYSEEDASDQKSTQREALARLDQVTTRIFTTFLPENESEEQRHCDLVRAQQHIAEVTRCSELLVINCGESNTQLLTTFKQVQNFPFDLDSIPNLATFVAFCERAHDWLMVTNENVLLLHAEGDKAQTRLLLLIRALSAYYEGSERFDPTTSRVLRLYVNSYPNGYVHSPVGWLRYTGYMRLFSPENCLSILRATIGIYAISILNFPVFEENKLRLFFKFYAGSPLRLVYTTEIHDISNFPFRNLRVNIHTTLDGKAINTGLRLQGDVTMLAYHVRPYPAKRLQLFRLHFHSCQAIAATMTFQRDDFDSLCDAFPSTMRLELQCSGEDNTKGNPHTQVYSEAVELSTLGRQQIRNTQNALSRPLSHPCGMLSADEAVRFQDSLDNIPQNVARWTRRLITFSRFDSMENWSSTQHSSVRTLSANVEGTAGKTKEQKHSVAQKKLKSIISSVLEKKETVVSDRNVNKEAVNTEPQSQLMPPPVETFVPKRAQKRKQTVGRRLYEILSGRLSQEDDSETHSHDSISKELNRSDSSTDSDSLRSIRSLFSSFRKKSKGKNEPPRKFRKAEDGSQVPSAFLGCSYSEDLLEAARRLNFMAGTQELDRLLEELRLTSMQMTAGLPPTSPNYAPRTHSYVQRQPSPYTQSRYQTTRSSLTTGPYGNERSPRSYSTGPSNYNYRRQSSSYHTERRLDGPNRSSNYPTYRSNVSPLPGQRQHSTYTTVLKHRPPMGSKQLSQVHLTIDPECGPAQTSRGGSYLHDRESLRREQSLESELMSARREIAQLRRAMSLVEERQRSEYGDELPTSPSRDLRSPLSVNQQYLSTSSSSYQMQRNGTRLNNSSTFQRTSPRQEGPYAGAFPLNKRAMSHSNVHGARTWNLRSNLQGSESELIYKRVSSASNPPGKPGYSAHRERLKQERERELLMRHQRQLAASSTGLNDPRLNQHHHQQQHQYRSLSAVNTAGDAVEEIETIILQPIGRGVQDIDSRAGSITTLARTGGSLIDGLNRMDNSTQRSGVGTRGYSSTQYLNRGATPTSELARPIPIHQTQAVITPSVSSQPLQATRYGTPTTMNGKISQLNGSRSQLSTASSTLVAQPSVQANGWKQETQKKPYMDNVDSTDLSIVQDTAPVWYRPNLSREAAIRILRNQAPGNFLIRDSTTFKGAYGLAVKVATLPPKVTPKSDDLQSELVRHYLIEVVNVPSLGVRLKGFASEPVFPSLAALIHHHTYDTLALPCLLTLPPVPTHLPSSGSATLPPLVIGAGKNNHSQSAMVPTGNGIDTLASPAASMLGRTAASSDMGSTNQLDGSMQSNQHHRLDDHTMIPINTTVDENVVSSQNVPFVCVLRESPTHQRSVVPKDNGIGQGLTFRCLMLGSVDTPQWDGEVCFSRAVDQLIPLTVLTAAECDNGISRVRYTEAQLHVSAHDGITIIDLQRRLLLRRHLPNHILVYCGLEHRKKEFQHPEHQAQGITHPQIFGIVVRKGISECTTHVFSECEPSHTASAIVQHIRATYPHLNIR